jgi:hypothetical protein
MREVKAIMKSRKSGKLIKTVFSDLMCLRSYIEYGRKHYNGMFLSTSLIAEVLISEYLLLFKLEESQEKTELRFTKKDDIESYILALLMLPKQGIICRMEELLDTVTLQKEKDGITCFIQYCYSMAGNIGKSTDEFHSVYNSCEK